MVPMAYQPTSLRRNFSDINIPGKIIIHFNLLTHRFRIVFEEGNKESTDRLSIASSL